MIRLRIRLVHLAGAIALTAGVLAAIGSESGGGGRARGPGRSRSPIQAAKASEVPAHPFDLILGRPENDRVTVSVVCYSATEGRIVYGAERGRLDRQTPLRTFKAGGPAEIVLTGLQPDTPYFYSLWTTHGNSAEQGFRTARQPGHPFTFTITADSHLDEHTDPAVYQRTLAAALTDAPDFHVDLGDTFMSEKHPDRASAAKQYLAQRFYFGQLASAVPLFLALGNHDGEYARGRGAGAQDLAIWSNAMRKRYFPNPVPDDFYRGNSAPQPTAGLLQDYYAWTWGDALFVVLDPFWYTQASRGRDDNWSHTLGPDQYEWLRRTLEGSPARFKFVFIHHLVGGADEQARGGVEAAPFYEWGGKNPDGTEGFARNRPGWLAPIHPLLVRNGVNAVFHGHDHLYAKQDLDGIVYQEVPQPGYSGRAGVPQNATAYGYVHGKILGSPGFLAVAVGQDRVHVSLQRPDGSVADEYEILAHASTPQDR